MKIRILTLLINTVIVCGGHWGLSILKRHDREKEDFDFPMELISHISFLSLALISMGLILYYVDADINDGGIFLNFLMVIDGIIVKILYEQLCKWKKYLFKRFTSIQYTFLYLIACCAIIAFSVSEEENQMLYITISIILGRFLWFDTCFSENICQQIKKYIKELPLRTLCICWVMLDTLLLEVILKNEGIKIAAYFGAVLGSIVFMIIQSKILQKRKKIKNSAVDAALIEDDSKYNNLDTILESIRKSFKYNVEKTIKESKNAIDSFYEKNNLKENELYLRYMRLTKRQKGKELVAIPVMITVVCTIINLLLNLLFDREIFKWAGYELLKMMGLREGINPTYEAFGQSLIAPKIMLIFIVIIILVVAVMIITTGILFIGLFGTDISFYKDFQTNYELRYLKRIVADEKKIDENILNRRK